MKLCKSDREKLYKAKGRSVEVIWPEDAPHPRNGKRYAVYNEEGDRLFSVRVERSHRLEYETLAAIRLDNDPVRILPGLPDEPERVHADYEALLCAEAQARNALLQGEAARRQKVESKESSIASSPRSQRAKERHLRALGA